jgi:hypothetical protein
MTGTPAEDVSLEPQADGILRADLEAHYAGLATLATLWARRVFVW